MNADETSYLRLLQDLIAIPSMSGNEKPLTEFLRFWAIYRGFEVDCWQSSESDLTQFGALPAKFIPLANRPTLVIRLAGAGGGRSLMFNGHTDVVGAPDAEAWKYPAFGRTFADGKVFGRGACDVKGPIVSALWAMDRLRQLPERLAGDLLLELIPGEEDCVGLGTLTSVARGWRADGVVVLEPTECRPCPASRGGLRFEITCSGQAVHGTVKWLGVDAIQIMRQVLDGLGRIEKQLHDPIADPLFAAYPITRPITVDLVQGGQWQGMVCDRCVCGGYFELLPADALSDWKERWKSALMADLHASGCDLRRIDIRFVETYEGHRTDVASPLCAAAAFANDGRDWQGFNAGCEAGLRAGMLGTPTLVWGPGSLAQAHARDEFVEWEQVKKCAEQFVMLATRYCI